MQRAETVLAVLRDRGRRGLPCNELYRQMFNRDLYLLAYGRIYANQGAMTPGASAETADGMSEAKIDQIIEAMRHERYRFRPARRIYIPKKNGKLRPLGLPSWSDKLVGEVVRLLLEAYYEPTFSDHSHGFRPGRGCHTALREVERTWTGTMWFIEGDISDCFGSLDHDIMIRILSEKIHDNRFLRLIQQMLKAGYLEDWRYHQTLSGAPQGGVVSPILSNIYLDKLDVFVETVLIPQYTRGKSTKTQPRIRKEEARMARARRPWGPGFSPGPAPPTCADCPRVTRRTPATGGCDIPGTPTITAGVHRTEGRSRGHQGSAGAVPARRPRARTQPGQDADHPRPHPGGPLPRLRDHRPALRRQDSPAAARRSTGSSRYGYRWM